MLEPVGLTLMFLKTIDEGPRGAAKSLASAPLGDIGTAIDTASTVSCSSPASSEGGFLASIGQIFDDSDD